MIKIIFCLDFTSSKMMSFDFMTKLMLSRGSLWDRRLNGLDLALDMMILLIFLLLAKGLLNYFDVIDLCWLLCRCPSDMLSIGKLFKLRKKFVLQSLTSENWGALDLFDLLYWTDDY